MPQEAALYAALLSDLTDLQLAEIIGKEMRRRNHYGVFYMFDVEDHAQGAFISFFPVKYAQEMSAAQQLNLAAAVAAIAVSKPVPWTFYDPDDDILSDTTPWRTQ